MARALLLVLRVLLTALSVVVTAAAALGWLYLIRRDMAGAGPPVANALALDQLSERDAVALVPLALVWAASGVVLGLISRALGLGRLAAALVITLGVGATLYGATGMSILVTQQIPASEAFRDAADVHAVYLAAALAGGCAALVARPLPRRRRSAATQSYVPLAAAPGDD